MRFLPSSSRQSAVGPRLTTHGQPSPHGKVFDIGIQTRFALGRIGKILGYGEQITPIPRSEARSAENGNGSLMRIRPMAFWLADKPAETHINIIREVSALTHPHIRSALGCYLYTQLAIGLLQDKSKEDAVSFMKDRVHKYLTADEGA